ncbi:MAG: hypothetical protein IJZ32_00450 [Clostridia bacterium]|nr:hypothetical protein [Clostridia bacterium]
MSEAQTREEYEYEKERKKKRKPVRKKSGVFGKILCLFLGLVLGIVATLGGIVGVGYWLYTRPLDKTVYTIDKFVDADLYAMLFGSTDEDGNVTYGYLNESYAEKTVKALIGDVEKATKALKGDNGTLAALNDISPKVGSTIDSLLKDFEKYNIPITREGLLNAPLKSSEGKETLQQYFENAIMATPAGDFFQAFSGELSPLLLALCYGEEDTDYIKNDDGTIVMLGNSEKTKLGDLLGKDMSKVLDKVPVEAVLKVKTDDAMLCTLAYGAEYRYTIKRNKTVVMNPVVYSYVITDGAVKFYDYEGEEISCTAKEVIPSLYALSVPTGEKDENGAPIFETQYAELGKNGNAPVYKDALKTEVLRYKKTTVGELQDNSKAIIDDIYLKDALDVTAKSHKVLISLAYGEYGVDYTIVGEGDNAVIQPKAGGKAPRTIGELRNDSNGLINGVQLSDVISEKQDDKVIMYLLYGRENVHYKIDSITKKAKMLQRRIAILDGQVYNEYGEALTEKTETANGYVLDETAGVFKDENGVTYRYDPTASFGTLDVKVSETKKTANLFHLRDEAGNKVYYEKTTLGDMSGSNTLLSKLTKRLTASEVLGKDLSGHTFFKHVQNETIADLPDAVEKLTIQQVFATDVFKSDEDGNFLDKDGNITTDPSERVLNREWWYLLHNEESCHAAGHTASPCDCINDFKLTEMSKLIADMKENVHLATLQQLSDDGMMKFTDGTLVSELKSELRYGKGEGKSVPIRIKVKTESGTEYKTAAEVFQDRNKDGVLTVGEITVEEMISYVDGVITAINTLDAMVESGEI